MTYIDPPASGPEQNRLAAEQDLFWVMDNYMTSSFDCDDPTFRIEAVEALAVVVTRHAFSIKEPLSALQFVSNVTEIAHSWAFRCRPFPIFYAEYASVSSIGLPPTLEQLTDELRQRVVV